MFHKRGKKGEEPDETGWTLARHVSFESVDVQNVSGLSAMARDWRTNNRTPVINRVSETSLMLVSLPWKPESISMVTAGRTRRLKKKKKRVLIGRSFEESLLRHCNGCKKKIAIHSSITVLCFVILYPFPEKKQKTKNTINFAWTDRNQWQSL